MYKYLVRMLIHKYQKEWESNFLKIKEVIEKEVSPRDIQIEHIGSTAVKNLDAKPIIDIDIVYSKAETFEEIGRALESLGYYHNGNQNIEGREDFI